MADDGGAQGADWQLPKFSFNVDLGDGMPQGFAEVGGLEAGAEPIEDRHGDSALFSRIKMPGLRRVGNVTLKRGVLSRDSGFWDWFSMAQRNDIRRRTVTINLLDELRAPAMSWTLTNAWPTRISAGELDADSNDVAVEALDIAYETMTVKAA